MREQRVQQVVQAGIPLRRRGEDVRLGLDARAGDQLGPRVFDEGAGGFRRGFQVKLQADGRANLEGLVFAGGAAGEMHGAARQVERLAVPLEDGGGGRK